MQDVNPLMRQAAQRSCSPLILTVCIYSQMQGNYCTKQIYYRHNHRYVQCVVYL